MEGIGGIIIGAAAVLLAVRFFKGKKAELQVEAKALPAAVPADPAPAKRASARRAPAAKSTTSKPAPAKPATKRPSRAKAAAKPAPTES